MEHAVQTTGATSIFFALLVVLLVGNEFLRDRLSSLRLLVSLYALVCFAFFTFFLPVMTGYMNAAVFLVGAVLSMVVTFRVVQLVCRNNPDRSKREAVEVTAPAFTLIGLLVGFYFLNWIPPMPFSMKFRGMYREIQKQDDRFALSFDREWYQVWKHSQNLFPADELIYCFTAVFAPVALNTTVYYYWYFRMNSDKPFTHADRIPIKIAGSREGGYRAYTFKQRLDPGGWRVDVEIEDGRVVGQVSVEVAERGEPEAALRTFLH